MDTRKIKACPDNLSEKNRRIIGCGKILSNIAHYLQTQQIKDERLHFYVSTGNREKVIQYLSLGAEPLADTVVTAVEKENVEIVKLLIDAGANVNIRNWRGNSPLILAVYHGHRGIVKLLIDAKADLNLNNRHTGHTPLIFAALSGNREITKLLIDAKVDLNIKDYVDRNSALINARGYFGKINDGGNSALIYAAEQGFTEIAKLLIIAGADVNIKNAHGYTALMFAAGKGFTEIVKLLIDAGADKNIKDRRGHTALSMASKLEIIDLLKSTTGGKRKTRQRQHRRSGGGNIANVFVPATNAQCNIRPRNKTMKQSNK